MASMEATQQAGSRVPCGDCEARALAAEVTSPVVIACLGRIQALAAETASARTLLQIERFVKLAREAWAVEQGVDFGPRSACDFSYTNGNVSMYPNPTLPVSNSLMSMNGLTQAIPPGQPIAPAALGAAENFGATAMRELIEAFTAKKPEEIVQAIGAAEKLGLADLARKLERLLGVESGPSGLIAPGPSTLIAEALQSVSPMAAP